MAIRLKNIFLGDKKSITPMARVRLVAAIILLAVVVLWSPVVEPQLAKKNYNIDLGIITSEDLYDGESGGYSGPDTYTSNLVYREISAGSGRVDLSSAYTVKNGANDLLWSSNQKYRIIPTTNQLDAGYGDKNREGYVFGQVDAAREKYIYWHPKYDVGIKANYIEDEVVYGLDTFRFETSFEMDVTQQYRAAGEYNGKDKLISKGKLWLWVEPQTGNLIKYSSSEEIGYYDSTTNVEISPWKLITDEFDSNTVRRLALDTEAFKVKLVVLYTLLPSAFALVFAVLAAFIAGDLAKRNKGLRLENVSAGLLASAGSLSLVVLYGWLTADMSMMGAGYQVAIFAPWATLLLAIMVAMAAIIAYANSLRVWAKVTIGLVLASIVAVSSVVSLSGYKYSLYVWAAICFAALSFALVLALLNLRSRFLSAVFGTLTWSVVVIGVASEMCLTYRFDLLWFAPMATPAGLIFALLGVAIYRSCYKNAKINKSILSVPWRVAVAVVGMSIIITGFFWRVTQDSIYKNGVRQFEDDTGKIANQINERVKNQSFALVGGVALFDASQEVTRQEWAEYFDSLHPVQNIPGITCVGYSPVVRRSSKTAFEQSLKAEGLQGVSIYPATNSDTMVVVDYVEPYEDCKTAIGFDMYSDETRRSAMDQARDTGKPVISGKIRLVIDQGADERNGFQMYVPVYKKGANFDTLEHRRNSLQGYVLGPVRMDDFMKSAVGNMYPEIGIEVFDTGDKNNLSANNKMYESNPGTSLDAAKYSRTAVLDVGNHSWLVKFGSLPDYAPGGVVDYSVIVLVGGLVGSVLLGAATYGLYGSRERALGMAKAMSHDLRIERNNAIDLQREDDAILSSMNEGMILVDTHHRVHRINMFALTMLGYNEKNVIGHNVSELITFVDEKNKVLQQDVCATAGRLGVCNRLIRRRDGDVIPVRLSVSQVQVEGRKPSGMVMIIGDRTRQYELDKAKDLFLSLATHQLKTPITAIKWYAEMLLGADGSNEVLPPTKRRIAQSITKSVRHMLYIVDNLLNVSRMETGRLKINLKPVNVPSIIHQVIEDQKTIIEAKDQKVLSKFDNLSDQVLADEQTVTQIFANLLNNASKYSPAGSNIEVAIRHTNDEVIVSFADHGLGIPKHQQHEVFKKFFRGENAIKRESSGNGLGLYLVKTLVKANKGKITFVSHEDKGTTFTVFLPRYSAKSSHKQL